MTWVVDGRTFAKKVKNPSHGACGHGEIITCPSCGYTFDQSNRTPEWPGLPVGVKFDPSDQELLEHLAAQVGLNGLKPHPFIDEFIPTLNGDDGICYTHPEKFPGIRCDGSSIHFFHRPSQAYMTGNRKRRKIPSAENSEGTGEVRWHKTGKTRPVVDNGRQLGCKKIMVLYVSFGKKAKPDKTNWVMHQYHLGEQEEEKNGELVVSKVFYQTQPRLLGLMRKGDDDDLQPAPLELTGGPAPSCPQTGTSATSIDPQATPSAPKTPGSAHVQMAAKRLKGLLGDITEEVERLSASMSVNFIKTDQSPEQSIGFNSAGDYCQIYKRSESVGFNSANDYCQVLRNETPLHQGSSMPMEDTGCSAEPRGLPNFCEAQSIHEVQPISRVRPVSEVQVENEFAPDNQKIMQIDVTCSMRSLSLPSVDAKMMSLLCSEQIQTAVNQSVPSHEQKTVGAETGLDAVPSHNSSANVGEFHGIQGAETWEHGVVRSYDAMVVNTGEIEVVGQQYADQAGQDGGFRPDSFSLDMLQNSDFSLHSFFGERFVNTQDMIDMKLNSLSSQELSQDFLKQFPDSQEALLDFIGKLRDSQKSEDDNGDKPT